MKFAFDKVENITSIVSFSNNALKKPSLQELFNPFPNDTF